MDPQQFLTELDSELRSVIGTLLGTAPATHDVTATDESGRVSVTLRPDRTLAKVQVAANWEEEIESPALAATIVEVAGTAQGLVMGVGDPDSGQEVDPQDVEEAREALLLEKQAELLAPMSAAQLQKQIDDLPALMDRLDAQLDDAIRRTAKQPDDQLPQPTSGRDDEDSLGDIVESENKMVSVQLFGGQVADVRIKESWLVGRSGLAVTECFDQIIARINERS